MTFGPHRFLVFLAVLITWFCSMILLTFAGRFHLSTSLRFVSTLLNLSHTFAHSLVLPLNASKLIMGQNLLSMPCTTCLLPTTSFFHLTCPYTSPQNGKAERVLRTLNNSVRTMLIHASMPPKYWAEALAAATYMLNRRPSSSIRNEIPYTRLYKSLSDPGQRDCL